MSVEQMFAGERSFLSNFYPTYVTYDRILFPTVEHAYQACKTLDEADRYRIAALATPDQAKAAGRRVKLRSDWDEIKLDIMYGLLCQKFAPNSVLGRKLVATGNEELIEWNIWHDNYWGIDIRTQGKGQNHLGKLLMRRREELR